MLQDLLGVMSIQLECKPVLLLRDQGAPFFLKVDITLNLNVIERADQLTLFTIYVLTFC